MQNKIKPAIWFPTIQTKSGTDIFTKRLTAGLQSRGLQSEIFWLPHRAEFLPWLSPVPKPPRWANITHINTWTHKRLIPSGIPVVATLHHCVNDPALKPYKTPSQHLYHQLWIKNIESSALKNALKTVAVSNYTASSAAQVYNKSDIEIIPPGIDINGGFYPNYLSNKPHEPFRLLFIGNYSARKGADLLIPIIKALGNEFELWILTGLRNKKIPNNELPQNIKFIQPCEDDFALGDLYRQCDALIFPSRLEGFGLVTLEAQACGLPIIGTQGSAISQAVANGITGLLCEQDNVTDFVSAARFLRSDIELWRKFKNNGPIRIKKEFSIERMVDQYISIYDSLLSYT